MIYKISKPNRQVQGEITLDGSKSLSNRALLIQALCNDEVTIGNLSTSKDTVTMQTLIANVADGATLDAGAAGTCFRFMTAYLSTQGGTQILTGTERMKQRPIGILVDALKKLGASIEYLENKGYPPLKIHSPTSFGENNQLSISADTSSQYISALLMLAPTLPNGLELTLDGKIVSRSYIEMTLRLMEHFGVSHQWDGQTIKIKPQAYKANDYTIEADWSAASYYYAIAAFAEENLNLRLNGIFEDSVQGDAVIAEMGQRFGLKTVFKDGFVYLKKSGELLAPMFEKDFLLCPDIAQTVAVICAGLGIQGLYSGLETLKIKETDRVAALQTELGKLQVFLSELPARFSKKSDVTYYMQEGRSLLNEPTFPTYEDHRMAMAFAPLAMYSPIYIEDPMVVVKSYPQFWEDLKILGFEVEEVSNN